MAAGEGVTPAIDIRALSRVEELEQCVQLQQEAWGFSERDLVPRRMFVVATKIGGLALGAWDREQLAGFALALPGRRGRQMYWHSHMLAVAEPYRDLGLGRQLKLAQRRAALGAGIGWMEWTFDPLEIKNSYFNLSVLGAIARRYYTDLYGSSSSRLQGSLPSDRLVAEWWLESERVRELAEPGESGRREPAREPVAAGLPAQAGVAVPREVAEWKAAGDERAVELQQLNRETLQRAFGAGLACVGYMRRREGGVFLLGRAPEDMPRVEAEA